ncbi:MAG TPA: MauE/DoxX family redox-associated membrane protein [bacterium]|nr:MauE/DoxX family redox-associated membrane protein [bacterium]
MEKVNKLLGNVIVVLACRLVLGVMFLAAATPKILDPNAFAVAVDNYHFLPTILVNLWAIVLPWVEVVVGVLLIIGPEPEKPLDGLMQAGALLSGLMYISFLIALGWALAHHLDIGCGCFDPKGTDSIDLWYLLRDSSLLAASAIVFFYHRRLDTRSTY